MNNVNVAVNTFSFCISKGWNYRISSDLFPLATLPEANLSFDVLPDKERIYAEFKRGAEIIKKNNLRCSTHPDQFVVPASATKTVVEKSIIELKNHASIMDLFGLPQSYEAPINIHMNCYKGNAKDIAKRFIDVYFSKFPGYYFTGDGAKRDRDGYYWITGRVDDILCVSGHNIGTAEVEGAIGKANGVAEAAVVGYTHDVKGHAICAFVTLMTGLEPDDMIYNQILDSVTKEIGPHAKPDKIHFTPSLPKTRSGKIMRRILRKISEGDFENLGDITTLADPGIVKDIISSLR